MQVTVKAVSKKTADKEGRAYLDRSQRPFTRVSIVTDKHGDKTWLSCRAYAGAPELTIEKGQVIDIETEQSGAYTNFCMAKAAEVQEKKQTDRIEELLNQISVGVGDILEILTDKK